MIPSPYTFFVTLCDVIYDVTGVLVLLGHQRFLSKTSDQIEIESREGHAIVTALNSRTD